MADNSAGERLPWLVWIDRFSLTLAIAGGAAAVGLMIHVMLDVALRYIFAMPLRGTIDFTEIVWMPTLISLGLGYALLRGEHIRVNLLTSAVSSQVQRIVEVAAMIFSVVILAAFIWYGALGAIEATERGESATIVEWLPVAPFKWVLVLGLIGLALQSVATMLRALTVDEFVADDDDEIAAELGDEAVMLEFEGRPVGKAGAL